MKRLVMLTLILTACAADDANDDTEAAEEGLTAVEASEDVIAAGATIEGTDTIIAAEAAIQSEMQLPACVSIETDHATFLVATFDGCTTPRGLSLDGTLRAELALDAGAVVYTLSTSDLVAGQTAISGTWTVRDPIGPGATTYSGSLQLSRGARTRTYATEASWTVSGQCVTYSIDASVNASGRARQIVATGVTRCLDACPASGEVTVTTARAGEVSWSYDGSAEVLVTGPNGGQHAVTLACGR
jgi:hypothetical protein